MPQEWNHPHLGSDRTANGLETATADAKRKKNNCGALLLWLSVTTGSLCGQCMTSPRAWSNRADAPSQGLTGTLIHPFQPSSPPVTGEVGLFLLRLPGMWCKHGCGLARFAQPGEVGLPHPPHWALGPLQGSFMLQKLCLWKNLGFYILLCAFQLQVFRNGKRI